MSQPIEIESDSPHAGDEQETTRIDSLVREKFDAPVQAREEQAQSTQYSEAGSGGLLEEGPLGWIAFGLIGGFVYGAYQSLEEWLNTL